MPTPRRCKQSLPLLRKDKQSLPLLRKDKAKYFSSLTQNSFFSYNTQMEQIVLKPEVIGQIGFLPVTNTMFVSWIVVLTLVVISILATKKVQLVPQGLKTICSI